MRNQQGKYFEFIHAKKWEEVGLGIDKQQGKFNDFNDAAEREVVKNGYWGSNEVNIIF